MAEYYIIPQTVYKVATINADNSTDAMGDFAFNMELDMNTYFRAVTRDEYDKYVEELEKKTKKRKSAPLYEYSLCRDRVTKHPFMVEERPVDYSAQRKLCDPTEIFKLMSLYLEEKAEEHLYMLTLNTKCQLTGVFLVGKGNVDSCIASVRDIMTRALLAGATGIILVHNHPSGDPTPSYEDFAVSRKVATACHLMEVELIDSIVIGDGVYWSIRQETPEAIKPTEIQF